MAQPAFPELVSIGQVENDALEVADVPSEGLPSRVRIYDEFAPALDGIEVGDHVYVIAGFDKADPRVLHGSPGTDFQQGAFSIRSSSRPNRIGLTLTRIVGIEGNVLFLEWLDFANGSPVLDVKRYNWRWEAVLSARRLDRRHIEKQIPHDVLAEVLTRPAVNFHGERCLDVESIAALAARLVQHHDVWLGSPDLTWTVRANGHVVDAIQGLTGATLGNGRLSLFDASPNDFSEIRVANRGDLSLVIRSTSGAWEPEVIS